MDLSSFFEKKVQNFWDASVFKQKRNRRCAANTSAVSTIGKCCVAELIQICQLSQQNGYVRHGNTAVLVQITIANTGAGNLNLLIFSNKPGKQDSVRNINAAVQIDISVYCQAVCAQYRIRDAFGTEIFRLKVIGFIQICCERKFCFKGACLFRRDLIIIVMLYNCPIQSFGTQVILNCGPRHIGITVIG